MLALRIAFVRTFTRAIWRRSPDRAYDAFLRFSDAESDSSWQFLQAMQEVRDPSVRGYLFTNALEECRHSELFASLAPPNDRRRPSRLREKVYDGNLAMFLARVHVAEENIYRQFAAYASAGGSTLRGVVESVIEDEKHHQENAMIALEDMSGSATLLERRARLEGFVQSWLRFSKSLHAGFVKLLLAIAFYPSLAARVLLGAGR